MDTQAKACHETTFSGRLSLKDVLHLASWHSIHAGVPVRRQLLELAALRMLRRQSVHYYYYSRLYRRSLSWLEKLDHFNSTEYETLCRKLNPLRAAYRHKIVQKALLQLAGVPTPKLLGSLRGNAGWSHTGAPLHEAAHLHALLSSDHCKAIVLKDELGLGGDGVHKFSVLVDGRCVTLRQGGMGQTLSCAELLARFADTHHGYLIEELFEQHPLMAAWNASSVNTVRVWVAARARDESIVLGAFLRVGRPGSFVDNTASGGLIGLLDEETGRVIEVTTGDLYRRRLRRRPDASPWPEEPLPYWQKVQSLATRVLPLFPGIRLAGLDIAIGPLGPAVIEVNVLIPSIQGFGSFDKPGRALFRRAGLLA